MIRSVDELPGHIAFAYYFRHENTGPIRDYVISHQQAIEKVLGYELQSTTRDKHLWLYTALKADCNDEADWPSQFAWYRTKHDQFFRAIEGYLKEIRARVGDKLRP